MNNFLHDWKIVFYWMETNFKFLRKRSGFEIQFDILVSQISTRNISYLTLRVIITYSARSLSLSLFSLSLSLSLSQTHTHTHTHIYIYIYIWGIQKILTSTKKGMTKSHETNMIFRILTFHFNTLVKSFVKFCLLKIDNGKKFLLIWPDNFSNKIPLIIKIDRLIDKNVFLADINWSMMTFLSSTYFA